MPKRIRSAPVGGVEGALDFQREEHLRIFGREPVDGDPVFLRYNYLESLQDVRRQTALAMRAAKIDPVLIYTYLKTEKIPTKAAKLSKSAIRQIRLAQDEFHKRVEQGEDIEDILSHGPFDAKVLRNFSDVLINMSHCLVRTDLGSSDERRSSMFFLGHFLKSQRAIWQLLSIDASYECFPILRSALESLLDFNSWHQDASFRKYCAASLGVRVGTHRYSEVKGRLQTSKIVSLSSGEESVAASRSIRAKAISEWHQRLFASLYPKLSSVTHSDFGNVSHFYCNAALDFLNSDFSREIICLALLLTVIMIRDMKVTLPFTEICRADLALAHSKAVMEMIIVMTLFEEAVGDLALFAIEYLDYLIDTDTDDTVVLTAKTFRRA